MNHSEANISAHESEGNLDLPNYEVGQTDGSAD